MARSARTLTLSWIANAPPARARNITSAASGAVNRLASSSPAANPRAQEAAIIATPTTTGHHSGPPHAPWCAVTPYTTATPAR